MTGLSLKLNRSSVVHDVVVILVSSFFTKSANNLQQFRKKVIAERLSLLKDNNYCFNKEELTTAVRSIL